MRVHSNCIDPLRRPSPSTLARNRFPFELAEHSQLAKALRMREVAFNEDVLPRDFKPVAPRDFYAAVDLAPSRRREQPQTKQGPDVKRAIRLPDRAA